MSAHVRLTIDGETVLDGDNPVEQLERSTQCLPVSALEVGDPEAMTKAFMLGRCMDAAIREAATGFFPILIAVTTTDTGWSISVETLYDV